MQEILLQIVTFASSIPVVGAYLPGVALIIAGAASVAAVTKTPNPNTLWGKVYKVLVDLPALNIGSAKDK